ncbi:MAG: LuxR C-terminal-related transcriptional regulator [Spirochaetota bacterium]
MARTLFFIEALILLAASALFSLLGALSALDFAIPLAVSLLVPLLACMSVWSPSSVLRAFVHAFSPGRPGPGGRESFEILEALSGFIGPGAAAGALMALIILTGGGSKVGGPEALFFQILAFLLFGVLYAEIALVLGRVVGRAFEPPENPEIEAGLGELAERHALSPREAEVAKGLLEGKSYRVIGEMLFISEKTVKTHASHIYEKTGCPNRIALVLLLHSAGGRRVGKTTESSLRPMAEKARLDDVREGGAGSVADVRKSDAKSAAGGRP